jgi:hypothetical protein
MFIGWIELCKRFKFSGKTWMHHLTADIRLINDRQVWHYHATTTDICYKWLKYIRSVVDEYDNTERTRATISSPEGHSQTTVSPWLIRESASRSLLMISSGRYRFFDMVSLSP